MRTNKVPDDIHIFEDELQREGHVVKYIPLDAVLAEIKMLHKEHTSKEYRDEAALVLEELEESIDSLKVKEIDLEKPFEGVKVQTSWESGSLDEIIVTTKYKARKGE